VVKILLRTVVISCEASPSKQDKNLPRRHEDTKEHEEEIALLAAFSATASAKAALIEGLLE
jgi:hypothetical protein